MKSARKNYEVLRALEDGEKLAQVHQMKGAELAALMDYAMGVKTGDLRDGVLCLVLGVAGQRYLAKQAAKARKKAKQIL